MKRFLAIVILLFLCPFVKADTPASTSNAASNAKIDFTEETLENGLHVIYAPLHNAPVVHARVIYHVGSRDERPDRQGFAHMFEHMMFRGSAHVAPEEHMKRIGTVGGISNAFTSFDQTVYHDTIPSQYLDMALWLEADRMSSFKVNEEIYKTERSVVAEEWRMRFNRPYGSMYEDFLKNSFTTHSYRWTPIGDMNHLLHARVNELQDFFNTYYIPNNATLVIAGDFDTDATKQLVKRYFGWIPRGLDPIRDIPAEPEQTTRREVTVPQRVPLPAVMVGYHAPAYKSDDHYVLSILDTILSGGRSSRLYLKLVGGENPMCVDAYSMHVQLEDPSIFAVGATVLDGKDPQKVRESLEAAVADVIEKGVTNDELEKAKTQLRIGMIHNKETATSIADQLGDEYLFGGDANRVNSGLSKLMAVTNADVQRVAKQYLQPQRATAMFIKPDPQGAAVAKAAATQVAAVKETPVEPSTAPVKPRVTEFPKDYPTTAPSAEPRANPEFAKGKESDVFGLRTIVMTDQRLPLVSWNLTLRRGSNSDPAGKEGLNWLTSEMLRRGVKGMSFEQLSRDMESRGISIEVGDGGDYTRLSGSCTTDQLTHAIDLSRQILYEPTFPPEEFAKLKEQSINSLKLSQENPTSVAGNELTNALFGKSTLGRYATPQSVESITLDDVITFYKTYYRPLEAIMVFSGDVTNETGEKLAHQLNRMGDSQNTLPPVDYTLADLPKDREIIVVDRPSGLGSVIRMGLRAYDVHTDDKFAGSIASQILTAGIDSRLMSYVRAKKGLAYSVHGVFEPGRVSGTFTAGADTKVETAGEAVEAIFKVFDDMRSVEVTPAELADAKMRVAGRMVMSLQTISSQASYRVEGILNGYPIDYYDKYPQRIAEVTAEQIKAVMNKYVDPKQFRIVIVAPAAVVKEPLEKLGDVKVVPMPAQRNAPTTQPAKKAA